MRIGLISDTHGLLRPEVFAHLADVEHILHAGDVGGPGILVDLAALAPVTAVSGNTDGWDLRAVARGTAELDLGGLRFALAHGHRAASFDDLVRQFPRADVIVHGHSHVPRADRVGGAWLLNPGSAGPGGDGWPPSVGIATIEDGRLSVTHIELATGRALAV